MIELLDAATAASIPPGWDGPVAGYPNRTPPWTPADFARFARGGVMRTSVRRESHWASLCREIDVEKGAAGPEDVPGFADERIRHGHHDATVYVDLSNWPQVRDVLEQASIGPARIRLRIADWTGHPHELGPDRLGTGWTAWAVQYVNAGPFDRTMVYGEADFARA